MSRVFTLRKVDHDDPIPKYLQVREILTNAIRSGVLPPGSKLPSTKEIGSLVDTSLITAHKALEGLVESGWLRREVGRGTFVREDVNLNNRAQSRLCVALLLDRHVNIDDYYHSTLINGLRCEARADSRGVEFFFHDSLDLRGRRGQDVGAICFHPRLDTQPEIEELALRYPVVVLGGAFPTGDVISVDCDNASGAREAVRHLIGLGHRRFMVLSGAMELSNSRDRAAGAKAELAAHGIEIRERDLPVFSDSIALDEETTRQVERRLSERDRPTAIVAGGFYLAMAAMQAVRRVGLSIPHDVSVVGFDDPTSASMLDPPLTTVRQPLNEMAARAYRLTRRLMVEGASGATSCRLLTELVVRDSTGPVP